MDITVPPGCAAGSSVEFTDETGRPFTAVVPEGLVEGDTFRVDIPAADILDDILDALTEDRFVALLDGFIETQCVDKFLLGGAGEVAFGRQGDGRPLLDQRQCDDAAGIGRALGARKTIAPDSSHCTRCLRSSSRSPPLLATVKHHRALSHH